jgi:phospholipase C
VSQTGSTRREFFKRGAAAAGMLLAAVERASAIDPDPGSSYLDAEHVVILMQENRSFDHCFGTLRGVRGFNDPRAVALPDSNPVWLQTNRAGETYAPFRLNIRDTKATWLGSLPHSWNDQIGARHHGNHDRWLDEKVSGNRECAGMPLTMGYYDRDDLPFYYALADAFTVCDQHFCSSLTGTTPNRLYLWSGTVRENAGCAPCVRNSEVDYGVWARWKTFPERLEDAGVSWRVYQNELSIPTGLNGDQDAWLANFTDNPLEFFDQYCVTLAKLHRQEMERLAAVLPGQIEELTKTAGSDPHLQKELAEKRDLLRAAQEERAKWTPKAVAAVTAQSRSIHQKAFTTNTGDPHYRELETLRYNDGGTEREMLVPKGDVLHRFRADVEGGKLPAVSWLVAPENFSDHPGAPWYGAWYVAEALNILTRNPDVWKKTIFVLTYDENDGYFDHVPPFVAPDPENAETGKTSPGLGAELEYLSYKQDASRPTVDRPCAGPIGLGFRVPLVVASPWSRGGYVCSQVFDHTSVLQLLENVVSRRAGKAVRETNISGWRRAVCGDLSTVFRPFEDKGRTALPFPATNEFLEGIHKAQFKRAPSDYRRLSADDIGKFRKDRFAVEWMPEQEKGVRPSAALPYELYVEGAVSADGKRFELVCEARNERFGKRAAGAPFHVYTPGMYRRRADLRTRCYTVAAGGRVADAWELEGFEGGRYDLHVLGPNGFYRAFAGAANDPKIAVECAYSGGDIEVRVTNHDVSGTLQVAVQDNCYGGGQRTIRAEAGKKASAVLALGRSLRWYDFSVTVEGTPDFLRRYAGRVENGEHGFSDPAMGRVKV